MDITTTSSSSSASDQTKKKIVPWVEKYRPEKVDDLSHQEEVVKTLRTAIEQGVFLLNACYFITQKSTSYLILYPIPTD